MQQRGVPMLESMKKLVDIFIRHSLESETLIELRRVVDDRAQWRGAKGLFDRVRHKTRMSEHRTDAALNAQYAFEEACAKTLYNLTHPAAPFDADSPYWIIPSALAAASHYAIPESEIVATFKA